MIDPAISLLAALCGALLFAAAALHKLRAPREFVAAVVEYRLLPGTLAPFVATGLASLEVAAGAALIWPATRPVGATLGMTLLFVYGMAMAINLARGRRDLDCGCGLARRTIGGWMIMRNIALAAILVVPQLPTTSRAITAFDYATVAGGLIVCALLYASLELLLARPLVRGYRVMESS